MSPIPDLAKSREEYRRTVALVYEKRLEEALNVARSGNTAIVIVPPFDTYRQEALNLLIQMLNAPPDPFLHALRVVSGRELHFEGTRGSVRIYPADHVTYDRKQKRLLDYPATIRHFLHPEVCEP